MTRFPLPTRWQRPAAAALAVIALGGAALTASGSATADHAFKAVPAPPASPTSADQIQNIDQVRTAIKGYYGDTVDPSQTNPVTGAHDLHTFGATSAYVKETAALEATATRYLKNSGGRHDHRTSSKKEAIVLDIDDTTLNTYNYEIYSKFVYDPTANAAFVNSAAFPAVPGMPGLVKYAASTKYTIFFLTGRPESQRPGTVTNLANAGYPSVPSDQLFLKDLTQPTYASCAPTCTTVQYKSLTRKSIEARGYDIVANFGDQYSDLIGGYADKTFKLPNPMYYLP